MKAHEGSVRFLDNAEGSLALFDLGSTIGGQKGLYMMNRAFYQVLNHFGVVKGLPAFANLRDIKHDTKVELLAHGNPVVDQSAFEKGGELVEPVEGSKGSEEGSVGRLEDVADLEPEPFFALDDNFVSSLLDGPAFHHFDGEAHTEKPVWEQDVLL